MLNIQFMTAEANGRATGEKDWRGNNRMEYFPNYDEMIANATCEEEREALVKAKEHSDRWGFTFEIVYTAKAISVDPWTYKHELKWQVLQHPWLEELDGTKASKEEMIARIEDQIAYTELQWERRESRRA